MAGRGDLAAFQTLVGRHQRRIFSLALRLARDHAEAEDMAQEAFLRIYRGLSSFRGESQFSTWMVRVALNTFNRYLKRLPKTSPLPERELAEDATDGLSVTASTGAGHADPESLVASREEAAQVRRLVAALPARFRDAITVFYLNERSTEEAAEALGISIGTLKSRLFRAREMLLERWQRTQSSAGIREIKQPADQVRCLP